MLEESTGQDNFLQMIDKLHVMNLSMEGAAILKSMADSIRSALEKGLLLEQIILNQRHNSLDISKGSEAPRKSKKKKRKHSNCPDEKDTSVSQYDNSAVVNQNIQQGLSGSTFHKKKSHKYKVDTNVLGDSDICRLDEVDRLNKVTSPTPRNLIKLVEPSLLIDSKLNSYQNQLANDLTIHTDLDLYKQLTHDPPNLLSSPLNHSLQHFSPSSENTISQHDSLYKNSSTPICSDIIIFKEEPGIITDTTEEQNAQLNTSISSDKSFMKDVHPHTPNKELLQPDYEQPVMPSPILIKSELRPDVQCAPEQVIPLNLKLNITTSIPTNATTPVNKIEHPSVPELEFKSDPLQDTQNPTRYRVFIEAGKDATEEEVIAVFKDLDVIYCRVINKPAYSFGFIYFSKEENMKAAIALSMQVSVGGKIMLIRPYREEGYRRNAPADPSLSDLHINQQKRSNHSSPTFFNKKQKMSRYSPNKSFYHQEIGHDFSPRDDLNSSRNDSFGMKHSRSYSDLRVNAWNSNSEMNSLPKDVFSEDTENSRFPNRDQEQKPHNRSLSGERDNQRSTYGNVQTRWSTLEDRISRDLSYKNRMNQNRHKNIYGYRRNSRMQFNARTNRAKHFKNKELSQKTNKQKNVVTKKHEHSK